MPPSRSMGGDGITYFDGRATGPAASKTQYPSVPNDRAEGFVWVPFLRVTVSMDRLWVTGAVIVVARKQKVAATNRRMVNLKSSISTDMGGKEGEGPTRDARWVFPSCRIVLWVLNFGLIQCSMGPECWSMVASFSVNGKTEASMMAICTWV